MNSGAEFFSDFLTDQERLPQRPRVNTEQADSKENIASYYHISVNERVCT